MGNGKYDSVRKRKSAGKKLQVAPHFSPLSHKSENGKAPSLYFSLIFCLFLSLALAGKNCGGRKEKRGKEKEKDQARASAVQPNSTVTTCVRRHFSRTNRELDCRLTHSLTDIHYLQSYPDTPHSLPPNPSRVWLILTDDSTYTLFCFLFPFPAQYPSFYLFLTIEKSRNCCHSKAEEENLSLECFPYPVLEEKNFNCTLLR